MPELPDQSTNKCFFITPANLKGEAKEIADDLLIVIQRAVAEAGYELQPDPPFPVENDISYEDIEQLLDAQVVIANLQDNDPTVYYEVAIRHTQAKPTILVVPIKKKRGEAAAPLARDDTVSVVLGRPHMVEKAVKEIRRRIEFLKEQKNIRNTIAKVFDDRKQGETVDQMKQLLEQMTLQVQQLHVLSDLTRKPLKGIPAILVEVYNLLKDAEDGSRIWLVGMTLGIGPPHAYRHATLESGSRTIEDEIRELCPLCPKFEDMVDQMRDNLKRIVKTAEQSTIVCLDQGSLEEVFLKRLANRPSYTALVSKLPDVALKVRQYHKEVENEANRRPVRYLTSLPLQLLILDKRGEPRRRGALVFHVGSENIEAKLQEDGELGFYTEIDQIVEMFATMAESLYETAELQAKRGSGPVRAPGTL